MKTWRIIPGLLLAVLLLAGCGVSKVKDISIVDVGITYIVPTSPRSMDAKLQVSIDNPAMAFNVQEITGTIFYNEKPFAHFNTGSMQLAGKCVSTNELPCTIVLDDTVSPLDILVLLARSSLDGLTADVDVKAALRKNGVLRAPYHFEKMPLSQFAKRK